MRQMVLVKIFFCCLLLLFAGCEIGHKERDLDLCGNRFRMRFWRGTYDSVNYKLIYIGNGQERFVLRGSCDDNPPQFENVLVTNSAVFAKLYRDYIRVQDGRVEVFQWKDIDRQLKDFSAYFYWLMDNEDMGSLSLYRGLYARYGDHQARVFLEKFVSGLVPRSAEQDSVWLRINRKSVQDQLQETNGEAVSVKGVSPIN